VTILATCFSLLQLPVPVLHSHDAYESSESLAKHVDKHHQQAAESVEELHWHFVLPWELQHDHDSEGQPTEVETDLVCLSASSFSATTGSLLDRTQFSRTVVLCSSLGAGVKRPIDRMLLQQHPASNLRLSVRACALLCVIRC